MDALRRWIWTIRAMDPAGARALARRIAEGKPPDDTPPEGTPAQGPSPAAATDGVVYVRPVLLRPAREVWMYLRRADGRLRRAR
jgi:hypothetical protein